MEHYADIEGPVVIGLWPVILMIVGGVVLVLLGLALIYWLLKRPRKEKATALELRRSPLEIALERLRRLKSGESSLEAEPFTVEVSDIVRDYLEEALDVPAREQTSEEFLNTLSTKEGMPEVLHEQMPAFLASCDRVKFARQSLDKKQQDGLLETARSVVESTDSCITAPAANEKPIAAAV